MKALEMKGNIRDSAVAGLEKTTLFRGLETRQLQDLTDKAQLYQVEPGETIVRQGDPGDTFFLSARGVARVLVTENAGGEAVEVGLLRAPEGFGEMGLLLDQPRNASVVARERMAVLRFTAATFRAMFEHAPGFGLATCRAMAERLTEVTRQLPLQHRESYEPPVPEVLSTLPIGKAANKLDLRRRLHDIKLAE